VTPSGKPLKGLLEDAEEIVVGRDIAIPELGMDQQFLLCPEQIEGLIGFVPLVGKEGIPLLVSLDEGGIDIKGRGRGGVLPLDGGHEITVDAGKTGKDRGSRN
jgi:hypothetical protein